MEPTRQSDDTYGRVFRVLDAALFEQSFRNWIAGLVGVIALDGKTVCGSGDGGNTALPLVSAFATITASGLCLGQEGTRGKGNEIAAIKALLDKLTLKGCIVTLDVIGCQTEIAQKIVDRGGGYLPAVKDNQGKLAAALRELFVEANSRGFGTWPVSRYETVQKDHSRTETRNALWINDLAWRDRPLRQRWPKLAGVGMVEHRREIDGKTSTERSFYIGSQGIANARTFAQQFSFQIQR